MMIEAYTPERPPMGGLDVNAEFDRLYLEKCKEVNELEQRVEKFKRMAEIAVKQKAELREQLEQMKREALHDDLISREKAREAVETAYCAIIALPQLTADQSNDIISQFYERYRRTLALINEIPAVSREAIVRELVTEPVIGFYPDVEPPEELPEELAESVPLWASQAVSSQDILCLSSALKNLYEIHKTDGWLLYNRLAKVLEQKIEEYCKEEG